MEPIKIPYVCAITEKKISDNGYYVSGVWKRFNEVNENGYIYTENCFDDFINNYFVKYQKNVPLTILHVPDAFHLAGVVNKIEKVKNELILRAKISKGAIYYEKFVQLIEDGVLQGFSDKGYALDYELTENGLLIRQATLQHISLVDMPAMVDSEILANATDFKGFDFNKQNKTETKTKSKLFKWE